MFRNYRLPKLFLGFVLAVLVAGPSLAAGEYGKKKDIVDTAVAAGSFQTLAAALTEAGLIETLKGDGPFTVFAPTDDAFAKLPKGTVESLLKPENRGQLTAILTYHVVAGRVPASAVVKLNAAETVNGQRIDIKVSDGQVMVDNATVVKTDIEASNGIIHVIDTVILPASENIVGTAREAGQFTTLIAAAKAAGLVDALTAEGPITVFAPTDDAFAKLPEGTVESLLEKKNIDRLRAILTYHVVAGRVFSDKAASEGTLKTLAGESIKVSVKDGKAKVNEAGLVATDIDASNGVIHVIDEVLLPSMTRSSNDAARRLIEIAIDRGGPMYNHGNAAGCTAVYEMTARALLDLDADMPERAELALREAMSRMSDSHNASEQAWILRRGLDEAHRTLVMEVASMR